MREFEPETQQSIDVFCNGTTFELISNLYHFDEKLRHTVFSELSAIELAVRAMLGHSLGRIDPLAHLDPDKLGARAKQQTSRSNAEPVHAVWLRNFKRALTSSKEDFVKHHKAKYDAKLPIWAAVEVMDWGDVVAFVFNGT
nr:Abi family protein [Yaniella halotolerans]